MTLEEAVVTWEPPEPLEVALARVQAVLPPMPPWVFADLRCDVSLIDVEPVTRWSVEWQHLSSGAYGTCASPTLDGLIEQIEAVVSAVAAALQGKLV